MNDSDSTSKNSGTGLTVRQRSATVPLAAIVLIGAVALGCGACSDTVTDGSWSFGDSTDEDAQNTTPVSDTGVDTGTSPDDTSSPPPDPDTGETNDRDTGGPGSVSAEGWYHSRFEKSLFARSAMVETREMDSGCWANVRADGEAWWMSAPPNVGLAEFSGTSESRRYVAKLRATGEITPRGEYGHLGKYDRRFDPDETEVLPCKTSKQLGSCVVPRPNDRCIHGAFDSGTAVPTAYRLAPGLQTRGPQTMTNYDLEILWRQSDGSRTRSIRAGFAVAWSPQTDEPEGDTSWFHTYDVQGKDANVDGLKVVEETDSGESSTYENVDGWIRLLDDARETPEHRLKLSLEGEASDGSTVHVWGTFQTTGPSTKNWTNW